MWIRQNGLPRALAKPFMRGLTSSVLRLARKVGAMAGGLVARICPAERQRTAEPPETASTLARMTYSHTMQEPLPHGPTPVPALTPAGERKEMTKNRAGHGIVVGFTRQP